MLQSILSFLITLSIHALASPHPPLPRTVTNTFKAGLGWGNGKSIDISQFRTTGKVSWYYSWSPDSFDTDLEFVPMFWGQRQVEDWQNTIKQTIQQRKPTAALGMNEPQESSQSNLTPDEGAAMWKTYIEPLKAQGLRLGSPAPSSAPSGKEWLQQWLYTSCAGGCTVDFIALHWYDVNATAFIDYLQDFHDTFQRPLWVTEWACQNFNDVKAQCSMQDIADFMNVTQSFMDGTEWVERYAWFGAMENMQGVNQDDALMTSNGQINDLGKQYIGAGMPDTGSISQPGIVPNGALSFSPTAWLMVLTLLFTAVW